MDDVAVLPALADVPAHSWDATLQPGQGTLRHAFLTACERVLDDASWRVLTVRGRGDALAAVSPGLIHSVDLAQLAPRIVRGAIERARKLGAGLLRPRILELGPPCCPGAPIACRDPNDLERVFPLIVDAAWREVVASGQAEALMIREFAGPEPSSLERWLQAQGFAPVAERPTFVARLEAATLSDHLAGMRAPYRRRAQRYLQAELRVRVTADFAAMAADIARLCEITTAHATESRREHVDADVVRGWAGCDRARAVLIESPAGDLLLAAVVLEDQPVLHFIRVGFDAASGRTTGVYPRLLYELCRLAIERRCAFVDFGLTSADPKLRVGAQPVTLRAWARHRNAGLQALLRAAGRVFGSGSSPPPRHVFRAPPPPLRPTWYGAGASRSRA